MPSFVPSSWYGNKTIQCLQPNYSLNPNLLIHSYSTADTTVMWLSDYRRGLEW
jgi:hypothetical protein